MNGYIVNTDAGVSSMAAPSACAVLHASTARRPAAPVLFSTITVFA